MDAVLVQPRSVYKKRGWGPGFATAYGTRGVVASLPVWRRRSEHTAMFAWESGWRGRSRTEPPRACREFSQGRVSRLGIRRQLLIRKPRKFTHHPSHADAGQSPHGRPFGEEAEHRGWQRSTPCSAHIADKDGTSFRSACLQATWNVLHATCRVVGNATACCGLIEMDTQKRVI